MSTFKLHKYIQLGVKYNKPIINLSNELPLWRLVSVKMNRKYQTTQPENRINAKFNQLLVLGK